MPKMTLLAMTQKILSSLDSDEVNSITDTVEAEQVADIIETSYYSLITEMDIPEHYTLLPLTALGDSSRPTHMKLPTGVDKIQWIKYNIIKIGENDLNYVDIPYVTPSEFLLSQMSLQSSNSNVIQVTEGSTIILVKNDEAPTCWTSFDDEYMVFNSYDSTIDSTLQASKTMAFGCVEPSWTKSDSFIPDLDSNLFPVLLADSTSMAFIELKQQAHAKAEKRARVGAAKWQKNKRNFDEAKIDLRPDYGRKKGLVSGLSRSALRRGS